jgi:hypothetical protein
MKRFLYVLIALIATLSFSMGVTSAAPAWGGQAWRIVPNPTPDSSTNSSFSSVAAVSPRDVWAVGSYSDKLTGASNAFIEHWNGARWSIVPSPNSDKNGLNAVAADRANDAWAVGFINAGVGGGTRTEHWNGTRWSVIPSPNPADASSSTFLAVTALSPHDAWAVGLYVNKSFDQLNLIEHWNGHRWSIVPSPNRPSSRNQLRGIAAVSANNIWAVGITNSTTLVEHWNGAKWSIIASPNGSQFGSRLFGVAALSATNIWAVGNYAPVAGENPPANTLVEHWDGGKWSIVPSPNVSGVFASLLLGVTIISARDVWAVGETLSDRTRGLIEHWDGTKWRIVASPTGTSESSIRAVARVPWTTTAWAVGDIFTSTGRFALTAFHG